MNRKVLFSEGCPAQWIKGGLNLIIFGNPLGYIKDVKIKLNTQDDYFSVHFWSEFGSYFERLLTYVENFK